MTNEELIEEARQEESIHDKLGDGFSEGSEERAFYYGHRDRYKRLADALEAATRQPTAGDREVLANHLREIGATCTMGDPCKCTDCESKSEWVNAPLAVVLDHLMPRAAVPDAATEEAFKKAEAFDKAVALSERRQTLLEAAEAERDAALAAIERIRQAVSGHPECDRYKEGDVISCGWKSAYASVVAALDGAHEPEGQWEYTVGGVNQSDGRVWADDEDDISGNFDTARAWADEALASGTFSNAIVVKRRVNPWLPVEGEGK